MPKKIGKILIASDHAGYLLKEKIKRKLAAYASSVEDRGTHSAESVDYPDYAATVARAVSEGLADYGVLVCGTGIGMAITANKYRGVRAAAVTSAEAAGMTRRHNDANVLCLGARLIGLKEAEAIVAKFFETEFEGGRHERRVDKIRKIEDKKGA